MNPIQILTIEDNPADVRFVQELLLEANLFSFELHHADSLMAAKKFLSANKVDVILLDLSLPDSEGLETFKNLYAFAFETPIIVLSGYLDESLAIAAVRSGAQDYILKSNLDGNHLSRAISYAIERAPLQLSHHKKITIQYKVIKALVESTNLYNAGKIILKTCIEILKWQGGKIWSVDSVKNTLKEVISWQDDPSVKFDNNEKIARQIQKNKAPFYSKTVFGAPILFENELLGMIIFWGKNTEFSKDQLLELLVSIAEQIGSFIKHRRVEGDLLYFSQHDPLTNIANRTAFENNLNKAIAIAGWQHQSIAVLYLDIDNFKVINDKMGHDKGDFVLKDVANTISNVLRETDQVARFGGDEFAIFLTNLSSKEEGLRVANKISRKLEKSIKIDNETFFITASIGVSIYPDDGVTVKELLNKADLSMYNAKKRGKNQVFISKTIHDTVEENKSIENKLYNALENHEFVIYYQPIVSTMTNKICGFEALLRWHSADGNIVLPDEFIPVAEESRLIFSIGNWVLKNVCLQVNKYPEIFKYPVSINVSVQQLYNNFAEILNAILIETHTDPQKIIIEITERTLMPKIENSIYILDSLKQLGVKVALDDFGTGYSSLSYIKFFSASKLKIDKSFIASLPDNPESAAIVDAIIAMAHALHMEVVAEGVETQAQLSYLKEKKCDAYQGFLFCKPLPIDELIKKIQAL